MFEYPLIRFDNRKWLKKLQNGELFLRSNLYYQKMESDDIARSDPYDGSIPFPDVKGVMKTISGKTTSNERISLLDRYIKCFYRCTPSDFSLTEGGLLKLVFSEASKSMINEFRVDSAMLMFSPSSFVNQVKQACNQRNERVWFGSVKYLNESDYTTAVQSLFENPSESYKLPFYKRIRFAPQQEFRICVQHPLPRLDYTSPWVDLSIKTIESTYTINIGAIEEAFIFSIDNLLNNGCLLDVQNEHYYVCEETPNAKDDRQRN